jgi:hypothetical protein
MGTRPKAPAGRVGETLAADCPPRTCGGGAGLTGSRTSHAPANFLSSGGEMGRLIREFDWRKTPLGVPQGWPQPLRMAVRLMLTTNHPVCMFWGLDLRFFYNDAYARSIGPKRHPSSLGQSARQVWDEVWDVAGPQIEQVMAGGAPTWHENQLVPITRHGRREDVYWTYSYGPIDDADAPNGVGGALVLCTKTTAHVLAAKSCRQPAPSPGRAASRWMARRSAAASTISMIAALPRSSAPSPPTPLWCWPTSTSSKNPTKFQQPKRCWPSSASRQAVSSRLMRSTVKKTFEAAGQADIALIVQVKNNQPTLLETITRVAATTQSMTSCQSRDTGRGRDERRTVTVFNPGHAYDRTEWKDHVRAILRVERIVFTRSAKTGLLSTTTEIAFYIANQPLSAERAAAAIRLSISIVNNGGDISIP